MKLSIVLLNYNTPRLSINCIRFLHRNYKKQLDTRKYEIILVDNKSTDNSIEKLQKEIKKSKWKISFIKSEKNTGFGGGCNLGAKNSEGEYLLFLNTDTIIQDNILNKMVDYLGKHRNISILGGGMLNKDGTAQGGCGVFPNFYHSLMILAGLGKDILVRMPNIIQEVDWVTGGCMLIKRNVFNKIKGFDENIFMYLEDMEICYRARLKGYKIFYYPFSNIIHFLGKSSNSSFIITHTYKGYLYFYKKHKNKLEYILLKYLFNLKFKIYSIYGKLVKNSDLINTYTSI